MTSQPITEHPDYQRVVSIRRSEMSNKTKCEQLAEVASMTSDPAIRLYASAEQISTTRHMGTHEAAVVTLAETLAQLDAADFSDLPRTFARDIIMGLSNGASSAMDVPEVDFEAIDSLLDRIEKLAIAIGVRPYLVWEKRSRRYAMSDDLDQVKFWTDRLLPHVNFTNRFMNGLGCPSCVLGVVGWLKGPSVAPKELETIFEPVLNGNTRYPGEDASLLKAVFKGGSAPQCDGGLQLCCTTLGRSLLHAGNFASAATMVERARALGPGEVCLLPEIASLEVALAMGSPEAIRRYCDELTPLAEKHEDIEEKFLGELRIFQAQLTQGRDASPAAAGLSAQRLDRRLGRATYRTRLEQELAEGPAFPLKDPKRRPSFLLKA